MPKGHRVSDEVRAKLALSDLKYQLRYVTNMILGKGRKPSPSEQERIDKLKKEIAYVTQFGVRDQYSEEEGEEEDV